MKYILYIITLGSALWLGFGFGGLLRQKPLWWRSIAAGALILLGFIGFAIPTGGTFASADMIVATARPDATVPILVVPQSGTTTETTIELSDANGASELVNLSALSEDERADLAASRRSVLKLQKSDGKWAANEVVSIDPIATTPLIPALEERVRNLYFHVPAAWVSSLAFMIAFFFAVRLMRRRPDEYLDDKIVAIAAVGFLFCIVATITGSIWAKFNWGSFWNWDPRQVSIVVVLLVYGAFFALRSAIESREKRARISAAYIILMVLPVLFFLYGYPRLQPSLHPGGQGDGTVGPVIDSRDIWLNPTSALLFVLGFFAFTLLFFWLSNLTVRRRVLESRLADASPSSGATSTAGAVATATNLDAIASPTNRQESE